jgi:hypothetical protein
MYIENPSPIKISSELYPDGVIKSWFQRTINKLRFGKTEIYIIGRAGVGKSVLASFLRNSNAININSSYTSTRKPLHYNLYGSIPAEINDFPGQSWQYELNEIQIRNFSKNKNRKILINVSSYGYNSLADFDYTQSSCYEDGMSIQDFLKSFCEENRRKDLIFLDEFFSKYNFNKTKIINFVSKQDLWWDSRQEVKTYYENIYKKKINKYFTKENIFIASGSIDTIDFFFTNGKILKKKYSEYTKEIQEQNINLFLNMISGLCKG